MKTPPIHITVPPHPARILPAVLLAFLILPASLSAQAPVFGTNFDAYQTGANTSWIGQDGWIGNTTNTTSQGIDTDQIAGLGNTAFLGFNQPDVPFPTIFRPVPMQPLTEDTGVITLRTLLGVRDATNDRRDSFHVLVANQDGNTLASVQFDNRNDSFGIWRLDGVNRADTGFNFLRAELHDLRLVLSFPANQWTAFLDGVPLFEDEPLHLGDRPLTLGAFGVGWQLNQPDPALHGDNWLLVADWRVETEIPLRPRILTGALPTDPTAVFQARATGTFQIERTPTLTDPITWSPAGPSLPLRAGQTVRLPFDTATDPTGFLRAVRTSE